MISENGNVDVEAAQKQKKDEALKTWIQPLTEDEAKNLRFWNVLACVFHLIGAIAITGLSGRKGFFLPVTAQYYTGK